MYTDKKYKSENTSSSIQQQKGQGAVLVDNRPEAVIQQQKNNTGLPDNLKTGMEQLSGHSLDDVKVHYNSSKPAQLSAHAYAQGNQIHLGPGQEKHLPHEAWHVVQQKQGRVQPTTQVNGAQVNDNVGLEKEADVMGAKALQMKKTVSAPYKPEPGKGIEIKQFVLQCHNEGKLGNQSMEVVQRAITDIPSKLKQFVYGMWKATTWEGLFDSINFGSKVITEFLSDKSIKGKAFTLATGALASFTAAGNALKKRDWYKVISHLTKAITAIGAIYYAVNGSGFFSKVVVLLIDHLAKNVEHIVNLVKKGYESIGTQKVKDDSDIESGRVQTV